MIPKGWEQKNFCEYIDINPRRNISKGHIVKYIEMAAVSESKPSVSHILEREFKGSGSITGSSRQRKQVARRQNRYSRGVNSSHWRDRSE